MPDTRRFAFAFSRPYALAGRLFGVAPDRAWVEADPLVFEASFGPWTVRTPRTNLAGVGLSGPYSFPKTIGPPRVSLADRGLTFATNGHAGACITFKEPVTGVDPLGLIRHPGLTVTVEDPEGFVSWLADQGVPRTDLEYRAVRRAAHDDLHTMSAADLRALARERGIDHPNRASRADLVALLEADFDDQELVDHLER
jgi:hypothetical protein